MSNPEQPDPEQPDESSKSAPEDPQAQAESGRVDRDLPEIGTPQVKEGLDPDVVAEKTVDGQK